MKQDHLNTSKFRAAKVNEAGFTLVEAMFSVLILAVSLSALSSFMTFFLAVEKSNRGVKSVNEMKSDLIMALSNEKAWTNVLTAANSPHPQDSSALLNPEMLCLKNMTVCNEGQFNLTFMDTAGGIIVDAIRGNIGFRENGQPCDTFSVDDPNAKACPFRFELKWAAICPLTATSCVNPQVRVTATLLQNSFVKQNFNMKVTSFKFVVDENIQSIPFALQKSTMTNSHVLALGNAVTSYDLKQAVFIKKTLPSPNYFYSLPFSASSHGGTLTLNGSVVQYDPPGNFYGLDSFTFTVTNTSGKTSTARIYVRVMTPHTWTGLAGGGDSRTSNLRNFCGVVVNGICDGQTFPTTVYSGAPRPSDFHFIFNENCTNCNAELNSRADSVEMAANYYGTVTQITDLMGALRIGTIAYLTWSKFPLFDQKGGTFIGGNNLTLEISSRIAPIGYPHQSIQRAMKISQGTFIAPKLLRLVGASEINNPASFQHNNGLVEFNTFYYGPKQLFALGVNFYDFNLGNTTTNFGNGYGYHLTQSFTVLHDFGFYPWGIEDSIRSGADVGPINPNVTIKVFGDIKLEAQRSGGDFCSVGCSAPIIDLVGSNTQTIQGYPVAWATPGEVKDKASYLSYVRVNKPGGNVVVKDYVGFRTGFEIASPTSVDLSGTSLVVSSSGTIATLKVGTTPLNDLYFVAGGFATMGILFIPEPELLINGNFYHYGTDYSKVRGLTPNALAVPAVGRTQISLYGDLFFRDTGSADVGGVSWVTLAMVSSTNQKIVGTGQDGASGMDIVIDKPAGTLTMQGEIGTMRDFWIKNGTVVQEPTSSLVIRYSNQLRPSKLTVPNTFTFTNLEIDNHAELGSDIRTKNLLLGTRRRVDVSSINIVNTSGNKIYVNNDLDIACSIYSANPFALIMTSSSNASIRASAGATRTIASVIAIDKSGDNISYSGALSARSINLLAGTFNMDSTSTLAVATALTCTPAPISVLNQGSATISGSVVGCSGP